MTKAPDDRPIRGDANEPPLIWSWPTNHCSCIQSRGTADETEASFFHRFGCFGDEVVVRVDAAMTFKSAAHMEVHSALSSRRRSR